MLANNQWQTSGAYGFDVNVIRYSNNGSIDPTFGTNGVSTIKVGYPGNAAGAGLSSIEGHSIAIASGGEVLVAGKSFKGGDANDPVVGDKITVVRLTSAGSPDVTFGNQGIVRLESLHSAGHVSETKAVVIQADGKILGSGCVKRNINNQWHRNSAVFRLNPNGTLDAGFGSAGVAETSVEDNTFTCNVSVDIQADGKILYALNSPTEPFIGRWNADGSFDNTYGDNGKEPLESGWSTRAIILGPTNIFALGIDGDIGYEIFDE